MRLLEARIKMGKINIQSVLLLSDLKGYVVVESQDVLLCLMRFKELDMFVVN